MRVCSDSSVVAGAVSKFDESAVLGKIMSVKSTLHCQIMAYKYLLTAHVEMGKLSKALECFSEQIRIDLFSDILDIAKDGLVVTGAGLGLLVVMACSLPAGTICG